MSEDDGDEQHEAPLYQVVDEAMKYLDPPSHETLTVESVAHAYTILQQAAAADDENSFCCQHHPRVQTLLFHNTTIDDWKLQRADLYRALLLASYLWLELQKDEMPVARRVLQTSVERCILLLQVLEPLPQSRYILLQAILEEPLVPLDKRERQYTYVLQRSNQDQDEVDSASDEEQEDDELFLDQRQLIQEEKELIRMASKEIPRNSEKVQEIKDGIGQQGNVLWMKHDDNESVACHLQVHACGILRMTAADSQRHKWYLLPSTTCNASDRNFTIRGCCTISNQQEALEFQEESSTKAQVWTRTLQQTIRDLRKSVKLQGHVQEEWKQEYSEQLENQTRLLKSAIESKGAS